MGGRALKDTFTRRYKRQEYFDLEREVTGLIEGLNVDTVVGTIKAYAEKESFGDMDLLVASDRLPSNFKELIKDTFQYNQIVCNGNVWSFDYKELQIDLILTPHHIMDFASVYYSYNDLGNLIGRIAHKFGLKFGHDGFWFINRDGGQGRKDILVSRQVGDIFDFLGFDYFRWLAGFNTLDDIFTFVENSKYFNPDIYLFENLNHTARVRDRKRSTYSAFVERCEKMVGTKEFFTFEKDKSVYMLMMFDAFPDFKDAYIEMRKDQLLKNELNDKFNGNKVRDITQYNGKQLGEFMSYIRDKFTPELVLSQSDAVIESFIKHYQTMFEDPDLVDTETVVLDKN